MKSEKSLLNTYWLAVFCFQMFFAFAQREIIEVAVNQPSAYTKIYLIHDKYYLLNGQYFNMVIENLSGKNIRVKGDLTAVLICGKEVFTTFEEILGPYEKRGDKSTISAASDMTGVVLESDCKNFELVTNKKGEKKQNRIKTLQLKNYSCVEEKVNPLLAEEQRLQQKEKIKQQILGQQESENRQREQRYNTQLEALEKQLQQNKKLTANANSKTNDSLAKNEKEILEKIEKFKLDNGFHFTNFSDGKKYEGNYENGLFNGYGVYTWPNGYKYEGNFRNGKRSGFGTFTFGYEAKYEGNWENNLHSGQGTYIFSDGETFDANWKEGLEEGEGIYFFSDGTKEISNWKSGKKNGEFISYYKNGKLACIYVYIDDKIWDKLAHYKPDGKLSDSNIKSGSGIVVNYYESGKIKEEINFKNGVFDGLYKIYHKDGSIWYNAVFKEGKLWNIYAHNLINGKPTGTVLKNGEGTVYMTNKEGTTIIKKLTYINGNAVKEEPF